MSSCASATIAIALAVLGMAKTIGSDRLSVARRPSGPGLRLGARRIYRRKGVQDMRKPKEAYRFNSRMVRIQPGRFRIVYMPLDEINLAVGKSWDEDPDILIQALRPPEDAAGHEPLAWRLRKPNDQAELVTETPLDLIVTIVSSVSILLSHPVQVKFERF